METFKNTLLHFNEKIKLSVLRFIGSLVAFLIKLKKEHFYERIFFSTCGIGGENRAKKANLHT